MSSSPDKPATDVTAPRTKAGERALLSLILPGLGQFAQRRFLAGTGQLATVVAYSATAFALGGGGRALLLSVAWNIWSAIDAYRHDRE